MIPAGCSRQRTALSTSQAGLLSYPLKMCSAPPPLQVAAGGAAPLLEAADAVLAVRRIPEKLFGCLDMHDAAEAALGPLQAAMAVGGSRLEHRSVGMDRAMLVGQLAQVRLRVGGRAGRGAAGPQSWMPFMGLVHPVNPLPSNLPPFSCAAGWRRRRVAALGSCRTHCHVMPPRACRRMARWVGWGGGHSGRVGLGWALC